MSTAYEKVKLARAKGRPTGKQYIREIFSDFIELHGDRTFADDAAVMGGIAKLFDTPVTVIAMEKGGDIKDKIRRNFGSPNPEGYKKALRLMKQAEKFKRPVICFVDTAGAFCGIGAEERGQGYAIATNLSEMMTLKTPILAVFIGEGGSGGALALAVSDEVWMLENAIYSVISPEGCASILWKDAKRVEEASEYLKLTSLDMKNFGIAEKVISEKGLGGKDFYNRLRNEIWQFVTSQKELPAEELLKKRYERFRKFGSRPDSDDKKDTV